MNSINNHKVSDIAKALDLSERRIQQLVKEQVLPRPIDGNYHLVNCIIAYEQYIKDKPRANKFSDSDVNELRLRLLRAQAEKAELELEVLKDKYIESSEVEFTWGNLVIAFRSRMLSIPSKLVRSIAAAGSNFGKIEQILEDEINEALTELSKYADDEEETDQDNLPKTDSPA